MTCSQIICRDGYLKTAFRGCHKISTCRATHEKKGGETYCNLASARLIIWTTNKQRQMLAKVLRTIFKKWWHGTLRQCFFWTAFSNVSNMPIWWYKNSLELYIMNAGPKGMNKRPPQEAAFSLRKQESWIDWDGTGLIQVWHVWCRFQRNGNLGISSTGNSTHNMTKS